jgi:hypothetical protein
MRGKLRRRKGHAAISRDLGGQNGIVNEVKANRPVQSFVVFIEPALDQIADHRNQFVKIFALRCHFRFVASRDKRAIVLFDLKNELFLHAQRFHGNNLTVLPRESNFSFVERKKFAHFNKIDFDFNFVELYKTKEQFNFIK